MKKTFTLIAAILLTATAAQAQRINNLHIKDAGTEIKTVSEFAAFNPNKNTGKDGTIEMVLLPGQQRTNLTIEPIYADGTALFSPTVLPTDFTNATEIITVKDDAQNKSAEYIIRLSTIKPAALPFRLNFNSNNLTTWTNETEGWAPSCIESGVNVVKFNGPGKRSFILAFSEAPQKITYKGYYESKNNADWLDPETVTIETNTESFGEWTTIHTFNKATPLAKGKEAIADYELNLQPNVRYVRFLSNRTGSTFFFNNFFITKSTGTAINSNLSDIAAKAFIASNSRELTIVNAEEVVKVELFNIAAQAVYTQVCPANTINLNALSNGIYMVRLTAADGSIATSKVVLK